MKPALQWPEAYRQQVSAPHPWAATSCDGPTAAKRLPRSSGSPTTAIRCPLIVLFNDGHWRVMSHHRKLKPPSCTVKPTTDKPKGRTMSDEVELPSLIVKDRQERVPAPLPRGGLGGRVRRQRESSSAALAGLSGIAALERHRARTRPPKPCGPRSTSPTSRPSSCCSGDDGQAMIKAQDRVRRQARQLQRRRWPSWPPASIHLVALAKIPGLMPNMSDDHLWTELSGPRYTTPLLAAVDGLAQGSAWPKRRHRRRQGLRRHRRAC